MSIPLLAAALLTKKEARMARHPGLSGTGTRCKVPAIYVTFWAFLPWPQDGQRPDAVLQQGAALPHVVRAHGPPGALPGVPVGVLLHDPRAGLQGGWPQDVARLPAVP